MTGVLTKGSLTAAAVVLAAAAAAAQGESPSPAERAQRVQARFQIAAMEGVLERAVQMGAQNVRVQVQRIAPELLFINGAPRARGFWLDGYGVFFDVDVPPIRRSLMWSVRVLDQNNNDHAVDETLQQMKQIASTLSDQAARVKLQQAVQELQRQVGPVTTGDRNVAATSGPQVERTAAEQAILDDPGVAYTNEVKAALVDAMIEYSLPMQLAPSESITVAARDQEGTRLQPGDPYEVSTLLLRLRGEDLAAYRSGTLPKDELKKRVEVKEY